uniref:Centrosomal protein 170Ab n=1 Tax=Cyprinus carpio carpio TaxID=630221 RepID=A0A8C1C8K9_CYPCA
MSLTSWFLVSGGGTRHRLPREMIFVGRDDCELMLQSRSVDKQHAVINYEVATDEHKVKDLGSLNGTFVNDVRIQEQQYITLKMGDMLRFGYDILSDHEKFTSQLQLTKKPSPSGETTKSPEAKGAEGGKDTEYLKLSTGDIAVLHRGTPLYGQPSWWGDGDADDENSGTHDAKASEQKQPRCDAGRKDIATNTQEWPQNLGTQEPSYFEIPCKETPPVDDTGECLPTSSEAVASASTIPALESGAHGHASFTIEFDTVASGKGKEKTSKSSQDHQQQPKRGAGEELSALQAAMVAAEVKVADWLAQNELPLARSESVAEDDGESVKSDVPVQLRSLRGKVKVVSERKRRTLPQLPSEDSAMDPLDPEGTRSQSRQKVTSSEKQDLELQEKVDQIKRISKTGQRVSGMASASMDVDPSKVNKPTPPRIQSKVGQQGAQAKQIEKKQDDGRRKKGDEDREKTGKPLLRQESFTVERSTANVPLELIPCIDGLIAPQPREMGVISEGIDAATMLKDSEAVAAFLETTLSDLADPPSYSLEGSVSPESDIDTTSTVSQAGGERGRKTAQRKRSAVGPGRETSNKNTSANERKAKAQPSGSAGSRAWTSLDLTDDDLSSSLTQDGSVKRPQGRVQNTSSKAEPTSGKTRGAKSTIAPAPASSKPTTLPRPRPTRASLLRRARLGEASDTDLADVDRMSVASEASTASSASRPSAGRRTLSRIEALAQPRRPRVGSPSARSDSEATSGKTRGFVPRPAPESALRLGLRSTVASSSVVVPRARANSASKLPDKCPGTPYVQSTPAAGGRWRRVPIEYASTSEDEYGSNRHPTQHTRPRPVAPRVTQLGGSAPATPSPGGISMLRHQSSREQDDYMRDWTAHSEEIARISQDLAKDLAMLAREIHDVAGEIDSVSPSSAPAASVEERVFEDVLGSAPEISGSGVELRHRGAISSQDSRAIRRRTWSREEGVLDSLLLASVYQLSAKIKQAMEKTANKIRILFKDKDRKWEEIESKLHVENEVPLLKTSNQEISSILQNLKRVERQLLGKKY